MIDVILRFVTSIDEVITCRDTPEFKNQVATNSNQQDNDRPGRPDSTRAVLLQWRFDRQSRMRPVVRKRRYVTRVPGLTEVRQVTDCEESIRRFSSPRRPGLCQTPLASAWATNAVGAADRLDAPKNQAHAARVHTPVV